MRYAILSFRGKPDVVFVEEKDRVVIHTGSEEYDAREQNVLNRFKARTVEQAVAGGYSYHDHEYGEYTGADKARVDKIIAGLPRKPDDD